jgi:hypothetical protein
MSSLFSSRRLRALWPATHVAHYDLPDRLREQFAEQIAEQLERLTETSQQEPEQDSCEEQAE